MHVTCSKALYNDQFTPSGSEAYIGASGSRFKVVHVCWYTYSFYRPRKDGKLGERRWERRSPKYSTLNQAEILTTAPIPPLVKCVHLIQKRLSSELLHCALLHTQTAMHHGCNEFVHCCMTRPQSIVVHIA